MSIFLLLAAFAAVIDWAAVGMGWTKVEEGAKPLVPLCLIGWAATVDVATASGTALLASEPRLPDATWWVVIALTFGLVGDVLLLPRVNQFIAGLAAFLVGHLAYLPPLLARRGSGLAFTTAAVVLGLVVVSVGLRIVRGARAADGVVLAGAVTAYVVVVAVVAVSAVATLLPLVAVGGVLFAISDAAIGWGRFVAQDESVQRRVFIHVTYHLAQGGLVTLVLN